MVFHNKKKDNNNIFVNLEKKYIKDLAFKKGIILIENLNMCILI